MSASPFWLPPPTTSRAEVLEWLRHTEGKLELDARAYALCASILGNHGDPVECVRIAQAGLAISDDSDLLATSQLWASIQTSRFRLNDPAGAAAVGHMAQIPGEYESPLRRVFMLAVHSFFPESPEKAAAEIVEALVISVNSVTSHSTSIYRKRETNNRVEATRYAIARGLME